MLVNATFLALPYAGDADKLFTSNILVIWAMDRKLLTKYLNKFCLQIYVCI